MQQVEADADERDAETRVAAVTALAAVAQKLFKQLPTAADKRPADSHHNLLEAAVQTPDSDMHESASTQADASSAAADAVSHASAHMQQETEPADALLVREHVLRALLIAVEDYSTDNRWLAVGLTISRSAHSCSSLNSRNNNHCMLKGKLSSLQSAAMCHSDQCSIGYCA